MKDFNLQEYLKNPSQKVTLRSGSDVRIICTDKKGEFPIVALVEDDDDEGEFTICYRKTGRFLIERESPNDLVFAFIKREGWVNVFDNFPKENHDYYCDKIYTTKEDAEKDAKKYNIDNYVTTTKIEWEE